MRAAAENDQRIPESPHVRRTSFGDHVRVFPRVQVPGRAQRTHPVQGGDMQARVFGPLSDGRAFRGRTFAASAAVRAGGPKRPSSDRSGGLRSVRQHGSAQRTSADGVAHSVRQSQTAAVSAEGTLSIRIYMYIVYFGQFRYFFNPRIRHFRKDP